jgi:hypothetical protein
VAVNSTIGKMGVFACRLGDAGYITDAKLFARDAINVLRA